jgi:glutamate decarboxylase
MAALHRRVEKHQANAELDINPVYFREKSCEIPRYQLPEHGVLPRTALQIVRDELILDGNARLNLATFVTTWMEPEAEELMAETSQKNMIDKDEYPQTAELEKRCVNILGQLWHAPHGDATGCSTTGSSEACMLGGMALLWRWRAHRKAAGKDTARPNLVLGTNVQVCWEKFCRYWDVEPNYVPLEPGQYHLDAERAVAACDENTIGVVVILGSTMDGSYEPVAEVNARLDRLQAEKGIDVPIHVDGASGGFVAPFLQPDLEWDFRVPRVASINTSGHKYGLVYPGVGWIIWRDAEALPEDLIFKVNYLGGEMPTFALNFSRPGAQVAAQYYNFLRLGFSGYKQIQQTCQDIAVYLSAEIAKLGPFELLSEGRDLPVFAFKVKDDFKDFTVYDVSDRLRMRGWQVPAYTFPENLEDMAVLRIVVRNGFSMDLANLLLDDLRTQIEALEHLQPKTDLPPEIQAKRRSFAH